MMQTGVWQRATGTDLAHPVMKILFTLLQETPESADTISFFFFFKFTHPMHFFSNKLISSWSLHVSLYALTCM